VKHVLVVQLARFGDLVQTKRLMVSLCAQADCQVHLCVDESLVGLAGLLYPGVLVHGLCAHGTGLTKAPALDQAKAMLLGNRMVLRELAALNCERVYNLNFSPLNFRLVSLFAPEIIVGHRWQQGQEIVGPWASLAMRWSAMRRLGLNIADFWAWHHHAPVAPQSVNPQAKAAGSGCIGVVMAGRESRRSLPPKVLANLAGTLRDLRGGTRLYLLGSASEDRAARAFLRELAPRHSEGCLNLCGKTTLADLPEVLAGLDLVITPDTGTMHLAAHLGVPVLATFLSSAWCHETGPYGLGHTIVQASCECSPCLESRPCPMDVECLNPFADPRLPRYFATGLEKHLPEGLLVMDSSMDDVGATYTARAGADDWAARRMAFRQFLAGHLHIPGAMVTPESSQFASRLYSERDWLPTHADTAEYETLRSLYE